MARVIVTPGAALDLERCRRFLKEKNVAAMNKAGLCIEHHFSLLASEPEMGRPFRGADHDLRECVIPFGGAGYIALYRYDNSAQVVYILAFRHQKEAGYAGYLEHNQGGQPRQ